MRQRELRIIRRLLKLNGYASFQPVRIEPAVGSMPVQRWVMWLTGRLVPDHKTFADFRKDNGSAIREVCARFVVLCRA